eukprot:CAMPEP_0117524716 /NCGR_PEP_ID=MMETSP0784-20121206/35393_1 /TAXON_ID=39447 /ORGANISM="" /LENGTH=541 /DNA_ID=CAMNT_0005320881 /DNA_START=87 /DNA_END=1712 /DNA_ORIENTATION=+
MASTACHRLLSALVLSTLGLQTRGSPWFPTPETTFVASELTQQPADFVSGLTEAFFSGSEISGRERHCLAHSTGALSEELSEACQIAMNTMRGMVHPSGNAAGASPGGFEPAPEAANPGAFMTDAAVAILVVEVGAKVRRIFTLEAKIGKQCLQGDAQEALLEAVEHMGNMSFVEGRVWANGADIMTELANAVAAFDGKDLHSFGRFMGEASRKVLLAERSRTDMPLPSAEAVQQLSENLVAELFGRGASMKLVTDVAVPVTMLPIASVETMTTAAPSLRGPAAFQPGEKPIPGFFTTPAPVLVALTSAAPEWAMRPHTVLKIHLHRCVNENLELFEEAWTPILELLRNAAAKGLVGSPDGTPTGPSMGSMAMAMLDLQTALQMCNIGPEEEDMLLDSLSSGSRFRTEVQLASDRPQSAEMTNGIAEALEDWRAERWPALGTELGKLLRSAVMISLSQKYAVDATGRLHRKMFGASESGPDAPLSRLKSSQIILSMFPIGLVMMMAVLVRAYHSSVAAPHPVEFGHLAQTEESLDRLMSSE